MVWFTRFSLGWMVLACAAQAAVEITPLSPLPSVRRGGVDSIAVTPDGTFAVYIATGSDQFRKELFAVALDRADATPVRINRPLPADSDVLDFALLSDSQTILYRSDEETSGQYELFTYDLVNRARRRLNHPLPRVTSDWDLDASGIYSGGTITTLESYSAPVAPAATALVTIPTQPGDVHEFSLSRAKTWAVYTAPKGPSGPMGHFLAKTDGAIPARLLPHDLLLAPYPEGYAFTPDESGLMVTRHEEGLRQIGRLNLDDFSVDWLDTWEASEESPHRISTLHFDPTSVQWIAQVETDGLLQRLRQIDATGTQPGRWLTEPIGLIRGVELAGPEPRVVVATYDQWAHPRTYAVRAYSLDGTPAITLAEGSLSASSEPSNLTVETPTGRLVWNVGLRWFSAQADGQNLMDLRALAEAAGLVPQSHGVLRLDETGRAHWFFHVAGASWRMDADGESAPVLIAPFAFNRIEEVNRARNRVLVLGSQTAPWSNLYPLYRSGLNGIDALQFPFSVFAIWSAPRSLLITPDGAQGVFVTPQQTLALADLENVETPLRVLSAPSPLTATATLRPSPNPNWALVRGAWGHANDTHYLLPLRGGPSRLVTGPSSSPNESIFWSVLWSPGGRFVVASPDSTGGAVAVDTATSAPPVSLPDRSFGRLVGLSPDGHGIYARGSTELEFSKVNLTTGEISALAVSPIPSNGYLLTARGMVSPDSRWLALIVDSSSRPGAIWGIPLEGGEARLIADRASLGAGSRVLGLSSETVYVSTYDDAVFALSLDGSAPVRLTEPRPASGGGTGATDVVLDLENRRFVYASCYPDGVRRLHRRSLDQPASTGYAAEVFQLEGGRPQLRAGVIAAEHENDLWVVGAEPDAIPRQITDRNAGMYLNDFFLSADGQNVFYSVSGVKGGAIYRMSLADGTRTRMTPPLTGGRFIGSIAPGADSDEVLFGANWENLGLNRIYRARLQPESTPRDGLNHPVYAAWVVEQALPPGTEGPKEDSDADGWPNLIEFIHRMNPAGTDADAPFRIEITNTATGWTEFCYISAAKTRAARVIPQISDDLIDWFDLPAGAAEITQHDVAPGTEWLCRFETPSAPSFFLRLRFELTAP